MTPQALDLSGQRFGRLVVEERDFSRSPVSWICRCDCGKKTTVYGSNLRQGATKSCGCLHDEVSKRTKWKTHGGSGTALYHVWITMKDRCYNEKNSKYHNYGGRGIAVCDEWRSDFEAFQTWAISNGYRNGLSIDRIDTNGPYSPNNCRWSTQIEQQNNRTNNHCITYQGRTQTIKQWADETGIKDGTIYDRINKLGWPPERALTEPTNSPKGPK